MDSFFECYVHAPAIVQLNAFCRVTRTRLWRSFVVIKFTGLQNCTIMLANDKDSLKLLLLQV